MRARFRSALGKLALAVGALVLTTASADAQGGRRTFLYVTGLALTVTSTSAADFESGAVQIGTMTFTVDLTANNPNFSPRLTTVAMRCAVCPASGTISAAGLQWRRGDLGTWNPVTATFTFVEQRLAFWQGANDPWSNTISFRYALDWATSAPAAATEFQLEFQLTVAAP
jgi:hypothetical protein